MKYDGDPHDRAPVSLLSKRPPTSRTSRLCSRTSHTCTPPASRRHTCNSRTCTARSSTPWRMHSDSHRRHNPPRVLPRRCSSDRTRIRPRAPQPSPVVGSAEQRLPQATHRRQPGIQSFSFSSWFSSRTCHIRGQSLLTSRSGTSDHNRRTVVGMLGCKGERGCKSSTKRRLESAAAGTPAMARQTSERSIGWEGIRNVNTVLRGRFGHRHPEKTPLSHRQSTFPQRDGHVSARTGRASARHPEQP